MGELPFSSEQFLEVFGKYNLDVWPMQILLYFLGIAAFILTVFRLKNSASYINGILAFMWLWMGVAYHWWHFAPVNPAAYLFGILFVLQGLIFLWFSIFRSDRLVYKFNLSLSGIAGILFLLYAFLIYPRLSAHFGHSYPQSPTFGLPCPTVIFTFGILLFAGKAFPKFVAFIPFLWSLIGFSAAISLGIKEDIGLIVAGISGLILLFFKFRQKPRNLARI
ncbi:MAG: DUF6064 family protein [Salegentibacter sp.]